jgi:hypothetical protein
MDKIAANWKVPIAFVVGALAAWLATGAAPARGSAASGIDGPSGGAVTAPPAAEWDGGATPNDIEDYVQLG